METSSPLAAMQPQALSFGHGHWHYGMDGPSSDPEFSKNFGFGASNFNFKDLSMEHTSPDYFSMRPGRGASPTASLAVDLSQNFHIDRSPQPPTPRRSLFTSNLFGNINGRVTIMTPPPLSSSPCPPCDSMDISPLPHKLPFSTTINVQSPTPEPTPSNDSMLSSPSVVPESPIELMKPSVAERRRPTVLRPSLTRAKGASTTLLTTKSSFYHDVPAQPFKFGITSTLPPATTSALSDCFVESPESATFPSPIGSSMGVPRPKSAYHKSNAFSQSNGSPIAGHVRKPNAPAQRPRKQFRRSLSMFEHPEEILNQQQQDQRAECGLQSIMDIDEAPQLQLPHFWPDQESIPRITKETMVDVLDGRFGEHYDQSLVIDCRFEYEYKGGHINGAINFNNKEELATKLFDSPSAQRTLLIFHCEYSAHRAPIAARFIRGEDRATNAHQYPKLTYPEVYILDGGYSSFFKEHKIRCFPQNYVEMNDKQHVTACERGLGRMRQNRGKLCRAQTFAFGQHSETVNDSPTAMDKQSSNIMMSMDLSLDDCSTDSKRAHARRMASF